MNIVNALRKSEGKLERMPVPFSRKKVSQREINIVMMEAMLSLLLYSENHDLHAPAIKDVEVLLDRLWSEDNE
jgi:hypothetical protein